MYACTLHQCSFFAQHYKSRKLLWSVMNLIYQKSSLWVTHTSHKMDYINTWFSIYIHHYSMIGRRPSQADEHQLTELNPSWCLKLLWAQRKGGRGANLPKWTKPKNVGTCGLNYFNLFLHIWTHRLPQPKTKPTLWLHTHYTVPKGYIKEIWFLYWYTRSLGAPIPR